MQQSSASFDNFSRQLPFGPKTLVFGATALIAYGLTRRSKAGIALAAAGGLLAYKAVQTTPTTADTHAVFLVNASPEQATRCGVTSRVCRVLWFTSNPFANSTVGVRSGSRLAQDSARFGGTPRSPRTKLTSASPGARFLTPMYRQRFSGFPR